MILCGSPNKKGNTNTIVGWVAEGAKSRGANVEIIDVTRLDSKLDGCTACMRCQESQEYRCVIEDDVASTIARIPEVDVLVFATPIYFAGPTAQLKCFMDRMFSLFKINQADGAGRHHLTKVRLALIATAGDGIDGGLGLTEDVFKLVAEHIGLDFRSLLVPHAPLKIEDLELDDELHEKATKFGSELTSF